VCAITLRRLPGPPYSMSMPPPARALWILLFVLGAAAQAGCDVFSAPGLQDIDLEYVGCTRLPQDTTAAFLVIVRADGAPLADPRLAVTSSDTGLVRVTLAPGGGVLETGSSNGQSTLTIRFLSSWVTDSAPTLAQNIQVNPGGGGCP